MPTDQVEEVKQKTNIIELISSFVPLTKAGKNYKGLCPFHSEKTPSFMVSQELQRFKCFGCGESGDVITFIQKIEGLEFYDALKLLAERAGVKLISRAPSPERSRRQRLLKINNLAAEFFHYLLTQHQIGEAARQYLLERGFKEETIATFKLGYAPDSWNSLGKFLLSKDYTLEDVIAAGLSVPRESGGGFYDRFRGRVIFPLRDVQGRTIGFTGRQLKPDNKSPKYLNTPETPLFKKGAFLYGLDLAKQAIRREGKAIIVEGQTDCISSHQAGAQHIVASSGTAFTPQQIQLLKRYTDNLAVCFDTDIAGDTAARRSFELAEEAGMNVLAITLPEKYRDADELIRSDLETWQRTIANPIPIYDFYFQSALKKHDPSTPLGKKGIGNVLLPIIAGIANDLQKAAYVKKLADLLQVSEGVAWQALEKVETGPPKVESGLPSAAPTHQTGAKESRLERHVLTLLLHAPLEAAKAAAHRLAKKDFTDPQLEELFSLLKDKLKELKRYLAVNSFRDKLDEPLAKLFDQLYLIDLGELADDEYTLAEELETTLQMLKGATTKRDLAQLSSQIKQAEVAGDRALLKQLQKEFNELSKKL